MFDVIEEFVVEILFGVDLPHIAVHDSRVHMGFGDDDSVWTVVVVVCGFGVP